MAMSWWKASEEEKWLDKPFHHANAWEWLKEHAIHGADESWLTQTAKDMRTDIQEEGMDKSKSSRKYSRRGTRTTEGGGEERWRTREAEEVGQLKPATK
jgi:hypothetical protein